MLGKDVVYKVSLRLPWWSVVKCLPTSAERALRFLFGKIPRAAGQLSPRAAAEACRPRAALLQHEAFK